MILIPYGFTEVDADNLPVQLPAFYIDRTEYAETHGMPLTNVTYDQARQRCEAAGKRLPKGIEWEKAVRGETGTRWPWGNNDAPERANVMDNPHSPHAAMPANSNPESASVYGVLNLIGNVWEWVDDAHVPKPRNIVSLADRLLPPPTKDEPWYAARGGAFDTPLAEALPYKFLVLPARYRAPNLGFRCAQSPMVP